MIKFPAASATIMALALCHAPAVAEPLASFDYVSYRALEEAPPPPEGQFRNPVLPGFHPDPSLTRVGDDFYLVTSTFAWFPGLPIFHSRDLVNWQLVGHAIDRAGQVDLSGLGTTRGLFAPAITHHDGRFWIVNTCVDCRGQFVITAERPEGPWSDAQWLNIGGIDPSLFFDEDGRAWIVYNDAPPGEPLYEGHRALWLSAFDPQAMQVTGEPILLVNGGVDITQEPVWAEGPHIYRHDGWYYLLTAEGGTAEDHSQTIYRSRNVTGPYEPGPLNPILTQRDLSPDRPDRVEATGHADIVQLDDGSWWGTFLATRPFEGQSTLLGRETFLLPLSWENGWPYFLKPGEPLPPLVERPNLPASPASQWNSWREDFTGSGLSGEWIRLRGEGPVQQWGVDSEAGALWMIAGQHAAGSLGLPAFTGTRLRHHEAAYETRLSFSPEKEGDFAGLLAFMNEEHFLAAGIEGTANGTQLVIRRRAHEGDGERGELLASAPLAQEGPLDLRLTIKQGRAQLDWRMAGSGLWQGAFAEVNIEPLASVHAELFTGLVVGPYALRGIEGE